MHSRRPFGGRSGQSLIESCLVVGLACLLFFGVFQLSQVFAAKEFLDYAAARGARAATVGLNDFMVFKTARIGSIPGAGKMTSPDFLRRTAAWNPHSARETWGAWAFFMRNVPASEQYQVERSRIPLYLGAEHHGRLQGLLNYEDWDTIRVSQAQEDGFAGTVKVQVWQEYPLRIPFHTAFYAGDSVELKGESEIENHHPLYLEE